MAAVQQTPHGEDERLDYARRSVLNFAHKHNLPPWVNREDLVQDGLAAVLAKDPPDEGVGQCAVWGAIDSYRRLKKTTGARKKARPDHASLEQLAETGYEGEPTEDTYFVKETLMDALHSAALHEEWSRASAKRERRFRRYREEQPELGVRELEVLGSCAAGDTADETAAKLTTSVETVKSQRRVVCAKLDARNITHAVAVAYETGLLGVDDRHLPNYDSTESRDPSSLEPSEGRSIRTA